MLSVLILHDNNLFTVDSYRFLDEKTNRPTSQD